MKHAELEDTLRATLAARAATITTGPPWHEADAPPRRPRWPRWLLPAAAVAAVLVAVGVVVAVRAAAPNGRPHRVVPAGSSCVAPLPTEWRDALAGAVEIGGERGNVEAVGDDGTMVAETYGPDGQQVAVIAPDGSSRVVYTVDPAALASLGRLATDGKNVLVPVLGLQGPSVDVSADAFGVHGPAVTELELVDVSSGAATRLAGMSLNDLADATHVIDGAALQDGHVYWDVRPRDKSHEGVVMDYAIAAGTATVLDRGSVREPVKSALGVSWGHGGVPDASVPAGIRDAIGSNNDSVVGDGSAFAWMDVANDIHWTDSHGGGVTPIHQTAVDAPILSAVVGPMVFFSAGPSHAAIYPPLYLLDTRTGAVAPAGVNTGGTGYSGGGVGSIRIETGTGPDQAFHDARFDVAQLSSIVC